MGNLVNNRFTRPLFGPAIRLVTGRRLPRRMVNACYNRLSFEDRASFFVSFAAAYRDVEVPAFEDDAWVVGFHETTAKVMLRRDRLSERWAIALAICGHDSEIKQTYENILASQLRPDVFVDIGANFGTHGLLFARSDVHVVAFEPNPECVGFAGELQALNGVSIEWHQVAIGEERRDVVLSYPVDGTWLGQVDSPQPVATGDDIRTLSVVQRRLDDYAFKAGRMLIKIDVEGHELAVLRGATSTLAARRPLVLFESHRDSDKRALLWDELVRARYAIAELPWRPGNSVSAMGRTAFLAAAGMNFIALPNGAL